MRISYSRPDRQRIVQNAYVVRDLDEAMVRWNRTLGIGPFLVRRHIALRDVLYRGRPASLDISAAHAQAGDIQIELVMQHCDQPSAFRDMFDGTGKGCTMSRSFPRTMMRWWRITANRASPPRLTSSRRKDAARPISIRGRCSAT
ncbi:hypothetical protein ACFSTI_06955 [Rhizorhabdus histidinilytica]